jgi:hypothetical protein
MKLPVLFLALLACAILARNIDLYYTEDDNTVKSIRGFFINDNFTLSTEGDESWLVMVGQKIGPNGYTPKESKLQLGTLGKTRSLFQVMNEDFLGFGHSKRFERSLSFGDIAYILPNPQPFEPLHVVLTDGTDGELFVAGTYTESAGGRVIQDKIVNDITIIRLKYDIPKSQRTMDSRPTQYGIRAKAVAFSENGLRKAIRALQE